MATNPITDIPSYPPVKLPKNWRNPAATQVSTPPPMPTTPPPESPSLTEGTQNFVQSLPSLDQTRRFLASTPSEQATQLPPTVQQIGRGFTRGVGGVAEQSTTPGGIASLVGLTIATAFTPPVISGLLKLGMTVQGIHDLAMKTPEAQQAFSAGDVEEGTRILTEAVPSLAMAMSAGTITKGELPTVPEGLRSAATGMAQDFALGPEGGFVTLTYKDRAGSPIGREHFSGQERVGGGTNVRTAPDSMALAEQPEVATMDVRTLPKTPHEIPRALDQLAARGVDPQKVVYYGVEGGPPMTFQEFADRFPEAKMWMATKNVATPTPPPTGPVVQNPLYRTPGGRISIITDPMKAQRRGQLEIQKAQQQAATLPPPREAPKADKVKQPKFPMEPVPSGAGVSTPEIPPTPETASATSAQDLFQHIANIPGLTVEQRLAMIQAALGTSKGPIPGQAASIPEAVSAAIKKPATTAATKPIVAKPSTPAAPGELEAQVTEAMKAAPKVELTPEEAGFTGGKKKGPVSYVGKTLEEKYAPKEPAAQPAAIKAAATPTTPEELRTALTSFEKGEGRPINIVRRGLGNAKSTRGTILYNIKAQKGKPTEYYAYMPDNWSGSPFPIKISEMQPSPMGKSHVMNVPRHAQRTYDLGMEVAVPRKAEIPKGDRVTLPDGSIGTHVENVVGGKREVIYFMKNLEEAAKGGDPAAQTRYNLFKSKLESKGYPTLARVALDDGRWVDFMPEEIKPAAELAPSTTKPSTQIHPETAAAEKEVRERMTSAGGEQAQPATEISNVNAISGEAIEKAKGIKPPEPRTQAEADARLTQLKAEHEGAVKTVSILKKQGKDIESAKKRVAEVTADIQHIRDIRGGLAPEKVEKAVGGQKQYTPSSAPEDTATRILNKYKEQLKPLEETENKRGFKLRQADELRAKIKKLGGSAAAPIPPPPDLSKLTPEQIRKWGESGVKKPEEVTPRTSAKLTEPPKQFNLTEWAKKNAPDIHKAAAKRTAEKTKAILPTPPPKKD